MRHRFLVPAPLLAAAALACSPSLNLPHVDTGPTETLGICEALPPGGSRMDVEISMGAGSLDLSAGAAGLVEGSIRYNVAAWRPTITRTDAKLTIEQGTSEPGRVISGQVVNEWQLRLGDVPVSLSIQVGAYSSLVDLTGLQLLSLHIADGASDSTVKFSSPNPVEMDELTYKTGASKVSLLGLGYANFEETTFEGGAGTYTLDFSGDLRRESEVSIRGGVSTMRIEIPSGTSARVTITGGLNDVTTVGPWSQSGGTYGTSGSGPALTMYVDMGLGSLTLIAE